MTKTQVAWAKKHHWFNKDNGDGTVIVEGVFNGFLYRTAGTFGSFEALKSWSEAQTA